MNKPITVVREETKQMIANVINDSGLPAFVIEPILQEFLTEIRYVAKKQYETEKAQYEQFLRAKSDESGVE